ncbi:hypothetical protein GpartN1_g2526.t1 [Galdieria partita]|uniref:Uncharacterized protein n=1 Tax=Galdieria partita TaxID=83374 RepID=A0A9C7UPP5_9RHOD|nr:hypothetical protein GpartN1_g2526.t1 [Galdieria partita]
MISCFASICIPFNKRRYCKLYTQNSKPIKLTIYCGARLYIYMRQTNKQQNVSPKQVSQDDTGSSRHETKLGDSSGDGKGGGSRESFKYVPGAQGKVDVWFIIGLLIFVIPIVAIFWGISTGVIDISSS